MRVHHAPAQSRCRVLLPLLFGLATAWPGEAPWIGAVAGAQESRLGVSPEAALERLKEGNRRFRSGTSLHPNIGSARLLETAGRGQAPFAAILGCSDSRVPCELVFDQGVGDLFVVRVAGNVCAVNEAGTIEYGISHLGTRLLVVLGHEECGAVTAVATDASLEGSLSRLADHIRPAVAEARRLHPGLGPAALVPYALRANVVQSIQDLLSRSEIARRLVREGTLVILGAVYDLETGEVTWLGPHPRQAALLKEGGKGAGKSDAAARVLAPEAAGR